MRSIGADYNYNKKSSTRSRSFELQPWTTVRGTSSAVTSVTQDAALWQDMSGTADAAFLVDVSTVNTPSGSVVLNLETSPSFDESSFAPVAPPLVLTAGTTPTLIKTIRTPLTAPLSRWTRWRLSAQSGAGTWDATFRVRGMSGRSSFFLPTQLQNCLVWLRADLGITINSLNGNVSGWSDLSGNGNNASQSTAAAQPPLNLAAVNGLPAIQGDGVHYYMTTNNITLGAQATIFAVVQAAAAPVGSSLRILEHNYQQTYYLGADVSTGANYKLIVDSNVPPYGTAEAGPVATRPQLVTGTYSSPTGTIYVYDSINGASSASGTFTAPTNQTLPLFIMAAAAGGFAFNGYLAEAIV